MISGIAITAKYNSKQKLEIQIDEYNRPLCCELSERKVQVTASLLLEQER